MKDEIRPGRGFYLYYCNMNDRSGIVEFRMGVLKLLVIRRGAGKKDTLYVKKKRPKYVQLHSKCREIKKRKKCF
jgi:hypothetical protein